MYPSFPPVPLLQDAAFNHRRAQCVGMTCEGGFPKRLGLGVRGPDERKAQGVVPEGPKRFGVGLGT